MSVKKQGAHSAGGPALPPERQQQQQQQPEAWRDLPITASQERVLRRWARIRGDRYPVMPRTRGEASDHITAVVQAGKRRDEGDAFDPPNDWDDQPRDWGDL